MDWNELLQSVLMAVLPILATALTGWALAQMRLAWGKFEATKPELAKYLEMAAGFAVDAAEQMKLADLITDKKAYALGVAEDWLALKGIKIDLHLIEAAIEAAVLAANQRQLELESLVISRG